MTAPKRILTLPDDLPSFDLMRPVGEVSGFIGYKVLAQLSRPYRLPLLDGNYLSVDTGFVTDGASIPPCAWWLVGPPLLGPYVGAAVGHDLLCRLAKCYADRLLADAHFYWWMDKCSVAPWRESLMFVAVRAAAFYNWRVTTEQRREAVRANRQKRRGRCVKLSMAEAKNIKKAYRKVKP